MSRELGGSFFPELLGFLSFAIDEWMDGRMDRLKDEITSG
jgi:hypothetical protein